MSLSPDALRILLHFKNTQNIPKRLSKGNFFLNTVILENLLPTLSKSARMSEQNKSNLPCRIPFGVIAFFSKSLSIVKSLSTLEMIACTVVNYDGEKRELSPRAMADAALVEALAERLTREEGANTATDEPAGILDCFQENSKSRFEERSNSDDDKVATDELKRLWEPASTSDPEWKQTEAVEKTITMVYGQIESVIRQGLEAYHGWECMSRDLAYAQEEIESKDRDLKRLRATEEQSCTTVSVSDHI